MTRIKFETGEFTIDNIVFDVYNNNPSNIIIHADLNTIESIAEFAEGRYKIVKEFDEGYVGAYEYLKPFEIYNEAYNVTHFFSNGEYFFSDDECFFNRFPAHQKAK